MSRFSLPKIGRRGFLGLAAAGAYTHGTDDFFPVQRLSLNAQQPPANPTPALSPLSFGAAGDGTADDTQAIRNMLASVPRGGGTIPFAVDLGPYTYRLTGTIEVSYRNVAFIGRGIGNPVNFTYSPGQGSTFRWDGPAGAPMIRLIDCLHVSFERIYFQGNSDPAKRPSDLIFAVGGGSVGTNAHLNVRKCRFGSLFWTNPPTPQGTPTADNGIRYGGANANNDRMFLDDVDMWDLGVGLALPNTQSVWGSCQNTIFTNCNIGVQTSASHTMFNVSFQGCKKDLEASSTARVTVNGWGSENSGLIADMRDPGGSLTVVGGTWLLMSSMTGPNFLRYANLGDSTSLSLTGVSLINQSNLSPKPKLFARRNSAGSPGQLAVKSSPGIAATSDFDVVGASGGIHLDISSLGLIINRVLGPGEVP